MKRQNMKVLKVHLVGITLRHSKQLGIQKFKSLKISKIFWRRSENKKNETLENRRAQNDWIGLSLLTGCSKIKETL